MVQKQEKQWSHATTLRGSKPSMLCPSPSPSLFGCRIRREFFKTAPKIKGVRIVGVSKSVVLATRPASYVVHLDRATYSSDQTPSILIVVVPVVKNTVFSVALWALRRQKISFTNNPDLEHFPKTGLTAIFLRGACWIVVSRSPNFASVFQTSFSVMRVNSQNGTIHGQLVNESVWL